MKLLLRATLVCMALTILAGAAHAFTIRGTLVNGTTGATNIDATVIVVRPSGGMLQEREVEARGGRFEIPDLDPQSPLYLLRVDWDGIPYNTPVQVTGQDQDVTITVYESTTSWQNLRVMVPHLAAVRDGDHLLIETLFEISNESAPPRTATGDEGYFHIYLPAEMDSLTACFVTSLGVPVDRTPVPTETPNVYRVEYPIRPGLTRVGVAYKIPYASGAYQLDLPLLYDLEHMTVFAVDPSMTITSSTHTLEAEESAHGMAAYSLANMKKGSALTLSFAGGSTRAPGMADGQEVSVVPGEAEKFSLLLMVAMLLVLTGVLGVTVRGGRDPLADPAALRRHYDILVARLARLDDLRAAEAVTADAHRAAREELVSRLGALSMRMRATGSGTPRVETPSEVPTAPTAAASGPSHLS